MSLKITTIVEEEFRLPCARIYQNDVHFLGVADVNITLSETAELKLNFSWKEIPESLESNLNESLQLQIRGEKESESLTIEAQGILTTPCDLEVNKYSISRRIQNDQN